VHIGGQGGRIRPRGVECELGGVGDFGGRGGLDLVELRGGGGTVGDQLFPIAQHGIGGDGGAQFFLGDVDLLVTDDVTVEAVGQRLDQGGAFATAGAVDRVPGHPVGRDGVVTVDGDTGHRVRGGPVGDPLDGR